MKHFPAKFTALAAVFYLLFLNSCKKDEPAGTSATQQQETKQCQISKAELNDPLKTAIEFAYEGSRISQININNGYSYTIQYNEQALANKTHVYKNNELQGVILYEYDINGILTHSEYKPEKAEEESWYCTYSRSNGRTDAIMLGNMAGGAIPNLSMSSFEYPDATSNDPSKITHTTSMNGINDEAERVYGKAINPLQQLSLLLPQLQMYLRIYPSENLASNVNYHEIDTHEKLPHSYTASFKYNGKYVTEETHTLENGDISTIKYTYNCQ